MDNERSLVTGPDIGEPAPTGDVTAPAPDAPSPPQELPSRPPGTDLGAPPPAPTNTRSWTGCLVVIAALLVSIFAGFVAGFAGASVANITGAGDADQRTVTVIEGDTEEAVAAVAAVAVPSVVNIDVSATRTAGNDSQGELPGDHPGVPVIGNGSGVVYQADEESGTYIITNDHVVEDASRIVVTDSTGERYDGEVVGTDRNTDVAVVHVDGVLPTIEIGDSDEVVVGQLVVAIGSPFGLQQSVTAGVVSAIGRSLPESSPEEGIYPLVNVIQTDAPINPGNSGGALLDRRGRLVGINTAIYSESGANEGIGFAVPVNTAARVADELIKNGVAQAPYLGIVGMTVTERLAAEEELPATEGALVVETTPGTEAEKSGLGPDDLIVGFDGAPIRSMDDLILAVRQSAVGDVVTLTIWRDGEKIALEMAVGIKPDDLSP